MARRTAAASLSPSGRLAESSNTTQPRAQARSPEFHTSGATPSSSSSSSSSHRVTRSAARLAAGVPPTNAPPAPEPTSSRPTQRKRKASGQGEKSSNEPPHPQPPARGNKRLKVTASNSTQLEPQTPRQTAEMSQSGSSSSKPTEDTSKTAATPSTSRQKSSRSKRSQQDTPASSAQQLSPPPRQRKRNAKRGSDVARNESDEHNGSGVADEDAREEAHAASSSSNNNDGHNLPGFADDDSGGAGDPFRAAMFGSRNGMGLPGTLRALSGMMSGISSRLRDILSNLRTKDDPSVQLIALQELSDLLLVSNEDTFAGHFAADAFVKELVTLMEPSETGEENPEIMLIACRCLANLMEAIRGSAANVVYGGAVPILCNKLLDIQFIDLAEQALSTLAKISVDYPTSIVRAGGLTACLTYLDFFPTSTQRTAVTTAANCCRNLPADSFPVVRDVMPTLLNVLSSNDQKVVEQGCICVSRVVESFKYKPEKLEELVEPDMLRAILRLLLPGTTNLIGPHIHTQFLRVLALTCRSSPHLSVELLKMNVVDSLYQILTGVSPPSSDDDDSTIKVDSVHIMQALIHRPREQVYETLNIICEILPGADDEEELILSDDRFSSVLESDVPFSSRTLSVKPFAKKRLSLLKGCQQELKKFATILLPTLTDTYSSTVNLGVRQKVLIAQVKMLQDLDSSMIEDALRAVPYASFLAAILSQKDHLTLVSLALQCARLLFDRLEDVYQYQFHREGVISEIAKLSETPLSIAACEKDGDKMDVEVDNTHHSTFVRDERLRNDRDEDQEYDEDEDDMEEHDSHEYDDYDDGFVGDHPDDLSDSDDSHSSDADDLPSRNLETALRHLVTKSATEFVRAYHDSGKSTNMRDKASQILENLKALVADIGKCYEEPGSTRGPGLFQELAGYFDGDAVESITSAELLNSGVIDTLLNVVDKSPTAKDARRDFLQRFMVSNSSNKTSTENSSRTPFGILLHKLHDLLSRAEHFEVITVNHSPIETRNAQSMLSKQLRLRLIADEESEIPRPYANMMVSIHAIANFKSLDDYLRPRISLSERPRTSRHRDSGPSPSSSMRGEVGEPTSSDPRHWSAVRAPLPMPMASGANRERGIPERTRPQPTSTADSPHQPPARTSRRRRHQPPPAEESSGESDAPLECADERHLTDDDDEAEDEGEDALDAIVDDLEDDMSEDGAQDPSAVNMEVGSGGTVTARNEDGTKVPTPHQSTPSVRQSSSVPNPSSRALEHALALAGRSFSSYAAAMSSIPQDWHIEFEIDGKPVSRDSTIYRAIHHNRDDMGNSLSGNLWSTIHTINFRRVKGPPPPEPSTLSPSSSNVADELYSGSLPESLENNPITASILQLLRVLHKLNSQFDDIFEANKEAVHLTTEPLTQFINTKLTSKLNRQLEEPLIVASSCLPSWSEDLARHFPFLFPFETRHLFLQSTSFGYSRSMMRWQNPQNDDNNRRDQRREDRPFPGRLQRQKVRISRNRILESATKVLELYGASSSVLEVEYFEEVGTGLGPTLEFYSSVSKEFSKKKLNLWRDHDPREGGEYVVSKLGLFPAPMTGSQSTQDSGKKQLQLFKSLGKFVARSMLDFRIVDIPFNPAFFRVGDSSSGITPSIGTVKLVDPDLANSLMTLKGYSNDKASIEADMNLSAEEKGQALEKCRAYVESLALDFTLPGYPNINMVPDGCNTALSIDNLELYISQVIDMTLGSGVKRQIDAFRAGFSQVFRYSSLKTFTPSELVMLFGQVEEDWSIETLMDSIKADHGFNMDSKSVRQLLETMSEFSVQQRRDFLQFVTGSPKLPIGGFKNLTPMFTVVCRPSEPPYTSDDYLPSVMTCVNYLKLPDYSTRDILRERLDVAMREGQGAFHLS